MGHFYFCQTLDRSHSNDEKKYVEDDNIRKALSVVTVKGLEKMSRLYQFIKRKSQMKTSKCTTLKILLELVSLSSAVGGNSPLGTTSLKESQQPTCGLSIRTIH